MKKKQKYNLKEKIEIAYYILMILFTGIIATFSIYVAIKIISFPEFVTLDFRSPMEVERMVFIGDPVDLVKQCNNLPVNLKKTLENPYFECKGSDKLVKYVIEKDYNSKCYVETYGEC